MVWLKPVYLIRIRIRNDLTGRIRLYNFQDGLPFSNNNAVRKVTIFHTHSRDRYSPKMNFL